MRRTKEEATITRERLLDAALASFHAKGYSATTLDDIARQAEITRGAIQWHFGGKAELFNTLIRERYQKAAAHMWQTAETEGTPLEVLRQMLIKWLSYTEEDADFRAMLELVMLKTEASPELAGGMQEKVQGNRLALKFFTDLIRSGITSGEIGREVNPEVTAIAAIGLVNGVTTLWLMDPTAFSLKGSAEETVDLFLRGIAQT